MRGKIEIELTRKGDTRETLSDCRTWVTTPTSSRRRSASWCGRASQATRSSCRTTTTSRACGSAPKESRPQAGPSAGKPG
jgi:hypothetical protein